MYRVCKTCGISKPLDNFTKHKLAKGGHLSHCKPCIALKSKEYKNRDPEKWKKINRDSKKKTYNSAKQSRLKRELYWKDPQKFRDRNRLQYQNNKDYFIERVLKYRKNNLGRYRLLQAERSSRKRTATPPWVTKSLREVMLSFYKEARRLTLETGVKHEVDHVVPLQHKLVCGLHVPWNLSILTKSENASKSNSYWPDMW